MELRGAQSGFAGSSLHVSRWGAMRGGARKLHTPLAICSACRAISTNHASEELTFGGCQARPERSGNIPPPNFKH